MLLKQHIPRADLIQAVKTIDDAVNQLNIVTNSIAIDNINLISEEIRNLYNEIIQELGSRDVYGEPQ
jgi:hypothetical protein